MCKMINKKGFTLIELIVVIAILVILAAIAVLRVVGFIEHARIAADQATVRTLNSVTTLYGINRQRSHGDIFEGFNTDEQRMVELVNEGFLGDVAQPQLKGAEFVWVIEKQLWAIFDGETMIPLSPLGSSFDEISSVMIKLINQRLIDEGSYGRTWGDYAYTDIGLDPKDWENPVAHIYFKPVGNRLQIRPAEGYKFIVEDMNGNTKELTNRSNHNLVYNHLDQRWYYHSISDGNEININTLDIKR